MHPYLKKIERITDALIVPALLAIFVIVILELFFSELAHDIHGIIALTDNIAITIFVVDVLFKFRRASTWEDFLKNHWLEVIAVMPFFIVFRLVEGIFIAIDIVDIGQHTAHLAEGARSGRFAEFFKTSELGRSTRFGRFLRAFSRTPRFAKAAEFFRHPDEE
jgi:hypothetical protein